MRMILALGAITVVWGAVLFSCDKAEEQAAKNTTAVSAAVLATHNSATDCWMSVDDVIYDVTSYLGTHPGGSGAMLPFCGADATERLDSHSQAARTALAALTVKGTLSGDVAARVLTAAEVATHTSVNDCWVTMGARVYNVSGYFAEVRPDKNDPFVHQGGLSSYTPSSATSASDNSKASKRTAIAQSLCGKDISYYFGESTTLVNTVGTYSFQVATGETCPSSVVAAPTWTSGATYLTSGTCSATNGTGTCSSGPCVFWTYDGAVTAVAAGATCPAYVANYSTGNNYRTSGSCASSATCTSGPCVFQVTAGSFKSHTAVAQRVFFEKYYIGTIQ